MSNEPDSSALIGPLSWVKGEIDLALERAANELKAHAADPQGKALGKAIASLHQAHGALVVVGLDGITRFTQGIETLLGRLGKGAPDPVRAVAVLQESIAALRTYLDDLMAGQPDRPLHLFPLYKALAIAGGEKAPGPELLFQPDLTQRPPRRERETEPLADEALATRLKVARLGYERGLVKWLKGDAQERPRGAREMKLAVAMIEATCESPADRAYWWVCLGVLDALAGGGLDQAADDVKPFALRLGARIKKLTEGLHEPAEAALVEALYLATIAPAPDDGGSPLALVRAAYRLNDYLPDPARSETQRLLPHLRRLRETLAAAKDDWSRFSAGTIAALPAFHERIGKAAEDANALGQSDYLCLTSALLDLANRLRRDPSRHNDSLALEVATALLLAEAALDDFQSLGAEFGSLVDALIPRLDAASQGEPLDALALPELERLAQRAQERLLTESVLREIRSNLGAIEQTLDAFFRDPAKKTSLASIGAPLRQVDGALAMLGQSRANAVLRECRDAIDRLAAHGHAPDRDEFEALAKKFAALSFFVEQYQSGNADIDHLLNPDAPPAAADEPAPVADEQPPAAPDTLRNDEAELLGVFLAEAHDVLLTIENHLPAAQENPDDPEALGTLRRAFHTLKGSSRMVGLETFGEAAWAVEQVMNNWLDSGRTATPELFAMLAQARALFADEVARVESGDSADNTALASLIARCDTLQSPPAPPADLPSASLPADEIAPAEAPAASAEILNFPGTRPVLVGDVEVTPALYQIYLDETRGHLAVLREQLGRDAVPGDESVRAAHTAASISAATGFAAVHSLAHALEKALERLAAANARPSEAERLTFARSVGALEGMLGVITEQRLPSAELALIDELDAITPPAPATPEVNRVPVDRRSQRIQDEIDPQLLPLFLEESVDLMACVGQGLRDWRRTPKDGGIADALKRALHTLKGSARMAGAMRCGELLHAMESNIELAVAQGGVTDVELDELEAASDRAAQMIAELREPGPTADVGNEGSNEVGSESQPAGSPTGTVAPAIQLRVRAQLVDQLVNEAGEIAIARTRLERQLRNVGTALDDLGENVGRLREQIREVEMMAETRMALRDVPPPSSEKHFDPLELDRFTRFQELARQLSESVSDVSTVQGTLREQLGQVDGTLTAQARLTRDLSLRLMNVRRVPFNSLAERLHRVVRQAAKETGKRANLDIRQGQTELDRSMLDTLAGPLEHLLRNSVSHGLEAPAGRTAAGKSEIGQVTLTLAQEGNEIVMVLADDGAGLDYAKIRQRAIERGLYTAASAPDASDTAALGQLIFQPGFSTARELTALSGRGVGMDVVKSAVAALGGRLAVDSERGLGARFTLYLPLTLAIAQAVLVKVRERVYAIPASMIEQAAEHKPESIAQIRSAGGVDWLGQRYPWRYLPELLGEPNATPSEAKRYWLVLVKGGSERIALEIDDLENNQEIVVKPLGPQLGRVPGLAGATVLADGEIALILNPIALLAHARERGHGDRALSVTTVVRRQTAARAHDAPLIMVVDDSVTVRKVTGRLLERHGYAVMAAKDGVDALEQLDQNLPDVILLDIEMPRMDGFGLARAVRADARLAHIPIIMITSRSADKHRQHAAEIGVNHFLGKPYDETELIARVADFIHTTG